MKLKLASNIFVSTLLAMGAITFGIKEINSKDQKYLESKAATAIATYYQSVNGSGSTLLSSINTVISSQTDLGYGGLWTMYGTTDRRADGKIYDLYSDCTNFTYSSGQCGSYSNIGDCYNREHTIPKSWWGGAESAQGSDGFIVLPSDGKVNGMRSNYPYGETTSGTAYRLTNDPQGNRLGTSTSTQYVSGTVFEPFDNRKGDLARTYFYAVARYLNQKSGSNNLGAVYNWTSGDGSKVFGNGSGYNNYIKSSYANMLLKWHQEDPVSDWEIQRNNLVENAQRNRNPFIDHPSWVDLIWGGTYGSNQTNGEDTSAGTVTNGQLTPSAGITSISKTTASLTKGGYTTTISATSSNSGTISWTTSNSNICSISSNSSASGSSITLTSGNTTGTATIAASITISGTTYTKTCTVTVSEPKSLSSISVSGQKTTYTVGSSFVKPTVTANYSDSTSADVTDSAIFTGFNSSSVTNSQTITVSYTESGTTKTTSYTISIVEGGVSDTYSHAFTYSEQGSGSGKTWTLTDCSSQSSSYWRCPESTEESVALFSDIFADKTITSDITITLDIATYGSGGNPSASTFTFYTSEACTSQVSASQGGALPTSSTYTTTTYTITQANATSFANDLAMKITKPGKQIRLRTITISFDYETGGSSSPTLSSIAVSTAPTKTSYIAGEYFNPTGLVITRTYSDSSSDTYTYANHTSEFTFTPTTSTALATNNTSVTIGYGGQTCQQSITVNAAQEKTLSSISVATAPTKISYTVDDTFDPTGLVITCNYSDSTSDTYTYANHTSEFSFTPSLSTPLTTLDTSVSITYGGKSCSQAITVQTSGGSGGGSSVDPSDISGTYSLYSGELTEGNYVITYDNKAMQNSVSSNRLTYSSVTPSNDEITDPSASIVWYISQSGGYWTLFNNNASKYAAGNGTKNQAALVSDITDSSKWTASEASTDPSKYEFVNKGNVSSSVNANLRENGTYGFACYSTQTGGALTLYKQEASGSSSSYTGLLENGKYYITNSTSTYGLNGASSGNTPSALTLANITAPFDFTLVGDNLYEISVEINSVPYYLVFNSTATSSSNTSVRVTSSPSASLKSTYWEIASSGTGYQFRENTVGSTYRYLGCNNTTSWYGYTGTGYGDQVIKVIAADSQSNSVVTQLNDLTCDASGTTAPSKSTWTTIASSITVGAEKTTLQNVTANPNGNAIQRAMAKYDYIVGKYGTSNYSDFLERNPSSLNSGAVLRVAQINDNMLITVISTLAIVSFVGFTYCLYIKKKRNRE